MSLPEGYRPNIVDAGSRLRIIRSLAKRRTEQDQHATIEAAQKLWEQQLAKILPRAEEIRKVLTEVPEIPEDQYIKAQVATTFQEILTETGSWGAWLALMHMAGTVTGELSMYDKTKLALPTQREKVLALAHGQVFDEDVFIGYIFAQGHRTATVMTTEDPNTLSLVKPQIITVPPGVAYLNGKGFFPQREDRPFEEWGIGWGDGMRSEFQPEGVSHSLHLEFKPIGNDPSLRSGTYLAVSEKVTITGNRQASPNTFSSALHEWALYDHLPMNNPLRMMQLAASASALPPVSK